VTRLSPGVRRSRSGYLAFVQAKRFWLVTIPRALGILVALAAIPSELYFHRQRSRMSPEITFDVFLIRGNRLTMTALTLTPVLAAGILSGAGHSS
jgi:hypothetical protein